MGRPRRVPFIGTAPFDGTPEGGGTAPPEARYENRDGITVIQLDGSGTSRYHGDGEVDAEIELQGTYALTSADFIL